MLNLVRFWILLSTLLVGGGWILSAVHQLNRVGYTILLSPLVRWLDDALMTFDFRQAPHPVFVR